MAYAAQADLVAVGLPQTALGALTSTQINAALQSASDRADASMRARYGMTSVPLVAWDTTITEAVAQIAAFNLMCIRGMNSAGPDWMMFYTRKKDAEAYLDRIQRQQAHPLVTLASGAVAPIQPNVTSSSVVNLSTGGTSGNRGW